MRIVSFVESVFLVLLLVQSAEAQAEHEVSGHLKHSVTDIHSFENISFEGLDFRLNEKSQFEHWKFASALQSVSIGTNFPTLGGSAKNFLPDDDLRLFRLNFVALDSENFTSSARLDRLTLGYDVNDFNLSIGRQALSVGKGMLFQSLDIFNPFSPIAIDKEYKPGDDMALARYQLGENVEIQGVAVGRRDALSKELDDAASSFGLRALGRFVGGDAEAIVAKHYNSAFYGGGIAKDLGGSTLRFEASFREDGEGNFDFTNDVNIDRGMSLFDRNLYYFFEYFHSGVGAEADAVFSPKIQRDLMLRRGELFTFGKNYGALGFRYELTPLVTFSLNQLHSLGDSSDLFQVISDFNLSDNLKLKLGAVLPTGGNSEFSSRGRLGAQGIAQGRQYLCWVEYYF